MILTPGRMTHQVHNEWLMGSARTSKSSANKGEKFSSLLKLYFSARQSHITGRELFKNVAYDGGGFHKLRHVSKKLKSFHQQKKIPPKKKTLKILFLSKSN